MDAGKIKVGNLNVSLKGNIQRKIARIKDLMRKTGIEVVIGPWGELRSDRKGRGIKRKQESRRWRRTKRMEESLE